MFGDCGRTRIWWYARSSRSASRTPAGLGDVMVSPPARRVDALSRAFTSNRGLNQTSHLAARSQIPPRARSLSRPSIEPDSCRRSRWLASAIQKGEPQVPVAVLTSEVASSATRRNVRSMT